MPSEEIYMYWLSTLYRLGSRKQNQLLAHFGAARGIFDAPAALLRTVPGFTENNIRTVLQGREMDIIEYSLNGLERLHIRYISRNHTEFPILLKEIPDPPVGLFCIGNLPRDEVPKISVIGSRRCSDYGLDIARKFSAALAEEGIVIVSGMAKGIDSMAHRGALDAHGLTLAVLGCGVDVVYPAENYNLRDQIAREGCIVSEYPPGVSPSPGYFPARNRIISGLSQIVLVVEAGKRSGTLITVEQALDQGRDVMVVPGNITSLYSEGTNDLIKQGAEPAARWEDVLHMLGMNTMTVGKKGKKEKQEEQGNLIAPEEKLVYDVLDFEPVTFDEIVTKTHSQAQTIQYILTMLELKGYVQKLPGMRYVRKPQT